MPTNIGPKIYATNYGHQNWYKLLERYQDLIKAINYGTQQIFININKLTNLICQLSGINAHKHLPNTQFFKKHEWNQLIPNLGKYKSHLHEI